MDQLFQASALTLCFGIAALLVLFLHKQCFKKMEGGRLSLRAVNAAIRMNHFQQGVIIIGACGKQPSRPIGGFHRNLEPMGNGA